MANKKGKTKSNKASVVNVWHLTLLIIVPIILLLLAILVFTIQQSRRLETSGALLDSTQSQISEATADNTSVHRDQYCWQTEEKIGPGGRYCEERLVIIGKYTDQQRLTEEIDKILPILEKNLSASLNEDSLVTFRDSSFVGKSSQLAVDDKRNSVCSLDYSAYDNSRDDAAFRNVFVFDIICQEGITYYNIYPLKARYGWNEYLNN